MHCNDVSPLHLLFSLVSNIIRPRLKVAPVLFTKSPQSVSPSGSLNALTVTIPNIFYVKLQMESNDKGTLHVIAMQIKASLISHNIKWTAAVNVVAVPSYVWVLIHLSIGHK